MISNLRSVFGCLRQSLRHRNVAPLLLLLATGVSQLLDTPLTAAEPSQRPNIVLIMADDLDNYTPCTCMESCQNPTKTLYYIPFPALLQCRSFQWNYGLF